MQIEERKGADDDRCIFKVTDAGQRQSYYKLYFTVMGDKDTVISDKYRDYHREYFVTQLLAKEGAGHIVKLDKTSVRMPKEMQDRFTLNAPKCRDKLKKDSNVPYLSTEAFDSKTILIREWLEKQTSVISADVIRTFMFQLVYLVAKIQAKFGVQHNDLYEENIMVRPVESGVTKKFTLPVGNDVFDVVLTKGHLEVFLFDFGASAVKKQPQYDTQGNEWEMVSEVALQHNNPPEVYFTDDHTAKNSEADAFMIGHVLLTLLAHRHPKSNFIYKRYMGIHVQDALPAKAKDLGLKGDMLVTIGLSPNSIVYELLGIVNPADKALTNELVLVNLMALDTALNTYDAAMQTPNNFQVDSEVNVLYTFVQAYSKQVVVEAGFFANTYATVFPLKDYVTSRFSWLKDVCKERDAYVFSFLRKLMTFDPVKRRAFSAPGTSYCLTSALFHPFFQTFYQGLTSATITDSVMPFAAPLEYQKDDSEKKKRLDVLQQREERFYSDLLFDFMQSTPKHPVSNAYAKGFDAMEKLPQTQYEDAALVVFPSKGMNKADAKTEIIRVAKLLGGRQALDSDELLRLEEEERKAREEAERIERERVEAEEKAARKAQEAAALKAQQDADAKKRAEAEAKTLADARAMADAKTKAEQEAAAKKVAEDARLAREAEEQEKRDKAAAEKADAEAAEQQRKAGEATREAEAAKAAADEAKRKAAEATRGTASVLADADLKSLAMLRSLIDAPAANDWKKARGLSTRAKPEDLALLLAKDLSNAAKTALEYADRFNAPEDFKEGLPNVDAVYLSASKNMLDQSGAINTRNVQSMASEIVAMYFLVWKKQMTVAAIKQLYNGIPDEKTPLVAFTAWFNAKLGTFYADIGLDAAAAATPKETVLPEKSDTSEGGSTVPEPTKPLKPTQTNVERNDGKEVTERLTEALKQTVTHLQDDLQYITEKRKDAIASAMANKYAMDLHNIAVQVYNIDEAKRKTLVTEKNGAFVKGTIVPIETMQIMQPPKQKGQQPKFKTVYGVAEEREIPNLTIQTSNPLKYTVASGGSGKAYDVSLTAASLVAHILGVHVVLYMLKNPSASDEQRKNAREAVIKAFNKAKEGKDEGAWTMLFTQLQKLLEK